MLAFILVLPSVGKLATQRSPFCAFLFIIKLLEKIKYDTLNIDSHENLVVFITDLLLLNSDFCRFSFFYGDIWGIFL